MVKDLTLKGNLCVFIVNTLVWKLKIMHSAVHKITNVL